MQCGTAHWQPRQLYLAHPLLCPLEIICLCSFLPLLAPYICCLLITLHICTGEIKINSAANSTLYLSSSRGNLLHVANPRGHHNLKPCGSGGLADVSPQENTAPDCPGCEVSAASTTTVNAVFSSAAVQSVLENLARRQPSVRAQDTFAPSF